MSKAEHLSIFEQGVNVWNAWRSEHPDIKPDLNGAWLDRGNFDFFSAVNFPVNFSKVDLRKADLRDCWLEKANLEGADLGEAYLVGIKLAAANVKNARLERAELEAADLRSVDFSHSNLIAADLRRADLSGANLSGAALRDADLTWANLSHADLSAADLSGADLSWSQLTSAKLAGANLEEVGLRGTVLSDIDFTKAKGLSRCVHVELSFLDYRTLARSKGVPIRFWRGCGVPEALIDYMPSLTQNAIQFYSCFISYSSKDQEFTNRLHADLQNAGVRCWFAPHDLPIGAKTWDRIDQAIRTRDKVLLILSEDAIASDWVEDEVHTAFEEERRRKETILLPIRLDDAVVRTNEAWASKLRTRNVGDFSNWKDHDTYKANFERILRDLGAGR